MISPIEAQAGREGDGYSVYETSSNPKSHETRTTRRHFPSELNALSTIAAEYKNADNLSRASLALNLLTLLGTVSQMNSDTIIDVRAAIAAAALYSLSVIGIVKAERTVERTGKSLHAIEKSAGPETLFAGRELFWLPRSRRAPGKFKTAETELAVQSTSDDFKPSSHWESARDKAVAKKSFHPDAPAITLGPLRPF